MTRKWEAAGHTRRNRPAGDGRRLTGGGRALVERIRRSWVTPVEETIGGPPAAMLPRGPVFRAFEARRGSVKPNVTVSHRRLALKGPVMPGITDTLDPELAAAFAIMPKAANGTLLDLSDIPGLREQLRAAGAQLPPGELDPRVTIDTLRIPRGDGTELEVVLYRPVAEAQRTRPALLWFHAGAQVLGDDVRGDDAYHIDLALDLDCVLAAVVYRLAPETPAPGAAEDGHLAYAHLIAHAAAQRIDPERIGLAGASGGGALAAATALMVRDRDDPQPCLLALLYPMLDDRLETPSSFEITAEVVFTRPDMQLAWAAVLGDRVGKDNVHPYAAPGRATDLAGLPDTFIAVAQFDVLRDDGIEFARSLNAAGVPADLHLYGRAFHAWDRFAPTSGLARSLEVTWRDFLRRNMR
jgi:acetyl esterase/lipase